MNKVEHDAEVLTSDVLMCSSIEQMTNTCDNDRWLKTCDKYSSLLKLELFKSVPLEGSSMSDSISPAEETYFFTCRRLNNVRHA